MRILHVIETLSPRHGGPVSVLLSLAEAQHRAGHYVTVVATNADYPQGTYHRAGWDTIANGAVRVLYGAVELAPVRFSMDVRAFLRRSIAEFDVVHIHGLYRFPPTYAAWQARKRGVPYVVRPHGALDRYLYGRSSAGSVWLKRLYERWFDLPNLHAAGAIHYTADEERKRAAFLDIKAPSFVVPNGLDWTEYDTLPARGRLRAQWSLGNSPVVLFLGRLHFKKGLDLLVPAFHVLRQRVPDVRLVIAGPENDLHGQEVRRWVRARGLELAVHFVGPLYGQDVLQAYVDADVFALPSYTENFGMTVIEAMAAALPVVISDQVNIHSEVRSAGAGLVTRCDVDEVACAMEVLLRDPERRRAMGDVGRSLVQAYYSWPRIVDVLTREYQAVIDRQRVPRGRSGHVSAGGS